ncbi:DUF916 and DUF3324 domain-containing protein [Vagococcus lutrae]|uniref:DUF916 and DUF3324 domain-containing protein n=1 Tax=Vagococcus lutrae TaxID=81947 RepID=UPI000F88E8C9|nr:DUF916 and DUF3324 domain-containing protein [Vagococcus lutrae]RST93739.1 hypothetical protein CBF33_00530 [Vagococcus lutrae]
MKIKKVLILIFCFILDINATYVSANEFNFSVEPIQAETQIDKNQTYFDIQVEPGVEQKLTIHLRNDTDQDIEISPNIASATTNGNGVVEYSKNDIKPDETLKYDLADLVKTEDTIIIPKMGTYNLTLTVIPPNEKFEGVIAGGITLKENIKESTENNKENGLAIKNEYSYVVAIILHSDSLKHIEPELKVKKVYPSQVNARNVIMTDFQNTTPVYLNNMIVVSEISRENKKEPTIKAIKEFMQVAPNTSFAYPVREEKQKIEAGKHIASITVFANQHEDGKYEYGENNDGEPIRYRNKWSFSEEFTITKEKARALNREDVTIKQDYTMWYIIGGLTIVILALLMNIYMTKRQTNEQKTE